MARFIDDIAQYIEDNTALTQGTNLFIGQLPDTPNDCVMVRATGGLPPHEDIPTKHPTFQVIVRDDSFATGLDLIQTIRDLLHRLYNQELDSGQTYAYYIKALAEPGHIGRDEAGRDEFSCNFEAYTR